MSPSPIRPHSSSAPAPTRCRTGTVLRPPAAAGLRRPAAVRRGSVLASSVLAAVLLAGCGSGAAVGASPATGSPSRTSAESSAPTEPAAAGDETVAEASDGQGPRTTSAPAGGGAVAEVSDGRGAGTASAPAGPTGSGSVAEAPGGGAAGDRAPEDEEPADDGSVGGPPPEGGTEGLPGWPIESMPIHGAQSWAAYVAVGAPGDPALQQVLAEVQELWPGAGLGELSCDAGAAEALGRDGTEHAVAVYFPTEQHITEFRRRWGGPYVGAVRVTTYCAD